jgi:hypothetical protein
MSRQMPASTARADVAPKPAAIATPKSAERKRKAE